MPGRACSLSEIRPVRFGPGLVLQPPRHEFLRGHHGDVGIALRRSKVSHVAGDQCVGIRSSGDLEKANVVGVRKSESKRWRHNVDSLPLDDIQHSRGFPRLDLQPRASNDVPVLRKNPVVMEDGNSKPDHQVDDSPGRRRRRE